MQVYIFFAPLGDGAGFKELLVGGEVYAEADFEFRGADLQHRLKKVIIAVGSFDKYLGLVGFKD